MEGTRRGWLYLCGQAHEHTGLYAWLSCHQTVLALCICYFEKSVKLTLWIKNKKRRGQMKGEVSWGMNHRAVPERKHIHAGLSVNPGSCLQVCCPEERDSGLVRLSSFPCGQHGWKGTLLGCRKPASLILCLLISSIHSFTQPVFTQCLLCRHIYLYRDNRTEAQPHWSWHSNGRDN